MAISSALASTSAKAAKPSHSFAKSGASINIGWRETLVDKYFIGFGSPLSSDIGWVKLEWRAWSSGSTIDEPPLRRRGTQGHPFAANSQINFLSTEKGSCDRE